MRDSNVRGGVLALDLSGVTGWCYGHVGERDPIEFGSIKLPDHTTSGARISALFEALSDLVEEYPPARVIVEAPLPLMAQTHQRSAQQQYTFDGVARLVAHRASAAFETIDSRTVRREVMGTASFAKGRVKHEVTMYCRRRLGWPVPDDNAADACLTWLWFVNRLTQNAPVAGPLFQERRGYAAIG